MKRQILTGLALVTLVAGSSTLLLARQTPPPTAGKRHFVTTDAELVRNKPLPSGNNLTTLTGDVVIQSEDSTLHTDKATYDGDTQIATAPSRLRLDDKQNTLVGDKGTAYYATRDAEFTGNITINARPNSSDGAGAPKGSLRREFKDPVTINCEKVRYNWQTKKAILTGNLTIKQKFRTVTGDRGLYDGVSETATLVGNIRSRNPTGETVDAPGANARAIVHFKEGEEAVDLISDPGMKDKKVRAVIPVREKEDAQVEVIETPDGTPPGPPAPQPSTSPSPLPLSPPAPGTKP